MCGIVAQHGVGNVAELQRMLERLHHRGPDESGFKTLEHGWLGHTRLSIVDLVNGRQPLVNAAGDAWLVGNGEIYNHVLVREGIGEEQFLTMSDNEVGLYLMDREPVDALAQLNGMFAFVMASDDGRFVAARDPVGIKPLYWARPPQNSPHAGITRFASEMHAFPPEWQPYVEPFPAGYVWTPERGLEQFASAVPEGPLEVPEGDLVSGTRDVIVRAVEHQMMGDVPVGVFLSGGLDSSLVAAIAARWCERNGTILHTFAIGTPGSPDIAAAREVAEFLGTEHREFAYDADDALDVLPEVVRSIESFDPGLVRSAVPNYVLARETSEHVKVVLTGEGADELFAGYAYMAEITDAEELHAELERTVGSLHNLNLQRCDRVTMAHGVEARVPFLELDVIEWALRLPASEKLYTAERLEKTLLREAFDGWLPHHLLWRVKAEFGDGSGARDVLSEVIESRITDAEFEAERDAVRPPLRSKEELAYYRVWREHLEAISPEQTLSRFARA
ncbi:MAG: asparagine synthetase B [Patulibacter sp.]|nr:asparagine synthetase B [Patulibacter sp.]